MVDNALVDTGALLAVLDKRDSLHETCVEAFRPLRLPLITSEVVLTELFYRIGPHEHEMAQTWKFLRSGAIRLASISTPELPSIEALTTRYSDCPMDFADAALA